MMYIVTCRSCNGDSVRYGVCAVGSQEAVDSVRDMMRRENITGYRVEEVTKWKYDWH